MPIMEYIEQPPNHFLTNHINRHLVTELGKEQEHFKEFLAASLTGEGDWYHIHKDVE